MSIQSNFMLATYLEDERNERDDERRERNDDARRAAAELGRRSSHRCRLARACCRERMTF